MSQEFQPMGEGSDAGLPVSFSQVQTLVVTTIGETVDQLGLLYQSGVSLGGVVAFSPDFTSVPRVVAVPEVN